MRFSLRTLFVASTLAGIAMVCLLKATRDRWGENRVQELGFGSAKYTISRMVLRRAEYTVICEDRDICSYLTERFRGSAIPPFGFHVVIREPSACVERISIELAEGGKCEGVAIVGMNGIRMALPPGNRAGWDYRYTHFVHFVEPIPEGLRNAVSFISGEETDGKLRFVAR